jgi:calcium-dependent protein kinase
MSSGFFESIDGLASPMVVPKDARPDGAGELMRGVLSKCSGAEWDSPRASRHFVLDSEHLWCRSPADGQAFSWALRMRHVKLELPEYSDILPAEKHNRLLIKLCYGEKLWTFFALSEADFEAWVQAFTKVCLRTDLHSRFKVSKIIGSGAFAKVYEGLDKAKNRRFAIKGFSKRTVEQGLKGKQSLANEISSLRRLSHPNISKLHEVHETANSIYLVFDLYEGGELHQLLKKSKRLPEEQVRKVSLGLLQGIRYLAENHVAHRDLKPTNIMLRKDADLEPEDVVIVDFGLCARTDQPDPIFCRCGTPGHVAPEIIEAASEAPGFVVSAKCDVFSVGVILYTMMAGSNPFENGVWVAEEVLRRNLECNIDFDNPALADYSRELVALARSMLRTKPDKRITADRAVQILLSRPAIKVDEGDFPAETEEFSPNELETKNLRFGSIRTLEKKAPMSTSNPLRNTGTLNFSSLLSFQMHSGGTLDNCEQPRRVARVSLYKQSLLGRTTKDALAPLGPAEQVDSPSLSLTLNLTNTNESLMSGHNTPSKGSKDSNLRLAPRKQRKKSAFGPDMMATEDEFQSQSDLRHP